MNPSCKKCETNLKYDQVVVQLAGGMNVYLCLDCRNEWDDYVSGTEAIIERQKLYTRFKVVEMLYENAGVDKLDELIALALDLMGKKESLRLQIRQLSRIWLAAKVTV